VSIREISSSIELAPSNTRGLETAAIGVHLDEAVKIVCAWSDCGASRFRFVLPQSLSIWLSFSFARLYVDRALEVRVEP
jgi:hypothetical protein